MSSTSLTNEIFKKVFAHRNSHNYLIFCLFFPLLVKIQPADLQFQPCLSLSSHPWDVLQPIELVARGALPKVPASSSAHRDGDVGIQALGHTRHGTRASPEQDKPTPQPC